MTTQSTLPTTDLEQLSTLCLANARHLHSAAQQVRNRGLKLILKTYAQQHVRFAQELYRVQGKSSTEADLAQASDSLERGWRNIRAVLIIRRERRQRLVIQEVLDREDELSRHYEALLQAAQPPDVTTLLHKQLKSLRTQHSRLALLAAEPFERKLFVRLFDHESKAEQVVQQLLEAGIADQEIDMVSIEQLAIFRQDEAERKRSYWETIRTGVFLGAVVGALLALIPGLSHALLLPETGGLFGNSTGEIVMEWVIAGTLVGSFFAFIFSLLISQDTAEDDAFVYDESLENGNTVVAVFAAPFNRSRVERIIGLKHQFEVAPAVA